MSFNFSTKDFDNIVRRDIKKTTIAKDAMLDGIKNESASSYGLEGYRGKGGHLTEANKSMGLIISEPEQFKLQKEIRKAFGRKGNISTRGIAEHLDFRELVDGGQKHHFITTMFVDIKGSTQLSLKYPNDLEFIHKFKNAVIKSCIEVIHAFDGCVHRIMGDAVLGFFGSTIGKINRPQSILDCLNAAAMLTVVLEHTIKPWLKQEKSDFDVLDFGFRVGCNFGNDKEVLWANYGYGEVGEVSPTGLPVDLAAKLQGLANKNNIMLGEGLLKYFNFPEKFCRIKTVLRDGEKIETPFVSPNYTKSDGTKLNYMMRSLRTHQYILGLPLPIHLKTQVATKVNEEDKVISDPKFVFNLSVKVTNKNGEIEPYISNTKMIKKDSIIKIILNVESLRPLRVYKAVFNKVNNSGFNNEPELIKHLIEESDPFDLDDSTSSLRNYSATATFTRDCNFKGLHHVKCEVKDNNGKTIFRDYVYVPIE